MRCAHVEKSNGISKKSNELDVPGQGNLQAFEHRLDRPTSGRYFLGGKQVSGMNDDELAHIRNRMIGFVFQGTGQPEELLTPR